MTDQSSALSRHDLEAKIVKRCWEDDAFRKEFTADPASVFVKYLKVPASSLPNIVIHQEAAGNWHIVLPAKPANTNELSEEDLEKIAGGASPLTLSIVVTIAASVSAGVSASVVVSFDKGW